MTNEKFKRIMGYLDILEAELSKIAKSVGRSSYEEFFAKKESKLPPLKKAA
jgi:uncharacterized HAD superfamily protein